jgi:purine-cytosine permease-like protein
VNQPENTSAGRIFWLTFLGVTIPCILFELLGMAFTTVPAYQNKGGGDLLAEVVQPLFRDLSSGVARFECRC